MGEDIVPQGLAADRCAISVVVPVYNEEESILPLYQRIRNVCESLAGSYEMIFVDDGSRDSTFEILEESHKNDARVKVIRFRRNFGQTAAMAAGFEYARGDIVVSMDGDLQNDPADIPRLLSKMEEGFDVVCGWRRNRQDKFWTRRVPSIAANWIIGRITGVRIHDNGCSLKAYRASVIKNVPLYGEMHRFIPAMSTLTGARIAEIVVNHHPRRFGKSKYGLGRIWRVVLDILTVKLISSFASRPAIWFAVPSMPTLAAGGAALLFAVNGYASGFVQQWLVMSTVAFLFFVLAAHLLTLGIIGELSTRTGDFRPHQTIRPTVHTL
jgi:glycosyltransferase involved in cell wall biosynthesis